MTFFLSGVAVSAAFVAVSGAFVSYRHYLWARKRFCGEFLDELDTVPENGEPVGRFPRVESVAARGGSPDVPHIFISHPGFGEWGIKEELARPTYWFLTEKLGLKVFLDDEFSKDGSSRDKWGSELIDFLAKPAYWCTHALVLLTPGFRKRKACCKELNTFMHRHRNQREKKEPNIRVLVALWKMEDTTGYSGDVGRLVFVKYETQFVVYYMLNMLWPRLLESLRKPPISRQDLQSHFLEYVGTHLNNKIPNDFITYLEEHREPWFLSPSSHPDIAVVGVSFSNAHVIGYDVEWNTKIWQRKRAIELILKRMESYGRVIEGNSPCLRMERDGFFGRRIVTLECIVHFPSRLNRGHYTVVEACVKALTQHLIEAGARESDVQRIIIGNVGTST